MVGTSHKPLKQRLKDAREQGAASGHAGGSLMDNPFPEGSPEARAWADAYVTAQSARAATLNPEVAQAQSAAMPSQPDYDDEFTDGQDVHP